jgi:CRISPR-associated endonuclease Cas1
VLLLAAVGLGVTFGVMGVINNLAHGELVMLAGHVAFVVQEAMRAHAPQLLDHSLFAALPLAFGVAGLTGILIERSIVRFLYGRPLKTLLATFGVSLMVQQAVRSLFGPTNREVANPSWMSGAVEVAGVLLTWNRVWIFLFALAVFVALLAFLRWSRFGLEMRAVTQNREIVVARIQGQEALLARLGGKGDTELREVRRSLRELERRARVAGTADEVSGYEGAAGALYRPALGSRLRHGFTLDLRRRRPPTDPVNAVVLWLSAMPTRAIEALVLRHGLHPGFGILHGTRDRHDGCVYDLVEEFRALLAEATAVALFNRRRLRTERFHVREDDGAVRLTPEGRTAVVRAWEDRLDTALTNRRTGRRTSWRGLMQEHVEAFARQALGEEPSRAFRLDC